MEIKVLRGSRIGDTSQAMPQQVPQQQQMQSQAPQMPSNDSSLLGRLGIALAKGIDAPVDFIDTLNMSLGEPSLRRSPKLSEQLINKLNYSPEQQEPTNPIERYGQKFLQQGPTAALFGLPAVASTAIDIGLPTVLGSLGAPEAVQDIAQLGGSIGRGIYNGNLPKKPIAQAQKAADTAARSLIPQGTRALAPQVEEAADKVSKMLATETNESTVNKVKHVVDTIKNNLHHMFEFGGKTSPRLNPESAMDLRKSLYGLTKGKNGKDLQNYINPLTQSINAFFTQYGLENPEFFRELNTRDRLTEARHLTSWIHNISKYIPVPKVQKLGKLLGEPEKLARQLVSNREVQKVYWDYAKRVVAENPVLATKYLNELGTELNAPNQPAFESPSKPLPKGFKVIKGQRIS
jgi:hypothetical protein